MYLISERVGFAARRGFIIMQNDEPQTFFFMCKGMPLSKGLYNKTTPVGNKVPCVPAST